MNIEQLGICEFCQKTIGEEAQHHETCDGVFLCEACAPPLSDIVEQHKQILERVPYRPGELPYSSRDEMNMAYAVMRQDLERYGDRKVLHGGTPHDHQ